MRRIRPSGWVRFLGLGMVILLLLGISPPAHAAISPVQIRKASDINAGDTAWMLTSSALVLMMTGPALALFYGGLVRRKNVLATMMQSFMLMAVVSVLWAIVGYSLAFDVGCPFVGGLRFAFLRNVSMAPSEYAPTVPHTTFMIYQMMFAVITPALICGAYAERMKFSAMLVFSSMWLLVIYCPMAHMVWGKGGLFNAFLPDSRFNIGALDFAGGTVVHISSGISALVCALMLGKRVGFGNVPMPPHSVVLSVIGAAMLWFGWFGFNGGSALAANGLAANAFAATHLAAAAGTLGWVFAEWIKSGKPTVLGAISGAVAGLVVITPASGFTTPMWAIVMGAIGGVLCMFSATSIKALLGYDDSLDAFGVHGVGGTIGAILTGVFAVGAVNSGKSGLIEGNAHQLLNQIIATIITWIFAGIGAVVLLSITRALVGLRVSIEEENSGLDLTQHGEVGYIFEEGSAGSVLHDGHLSAAAVKEQPRPASEPPNGQRRFAILVEGTDNDALINAWSALCQVHEAPPTAEFKSVYPYLTTVQGNRFRFRGGDPNLIRENLTKLFQKTLRNPAIRARLDTN